VLGENLALQIGDDDSIAGADNEDMLKGPVRIDHVGN
jgi:hypothetical protein